MSKEIFVTLMIIVCIIILMGFVLLIVYIVSIHQKNRVQFLLEMETLKNNFKNEILLSELEMQESTFETISMEIHDNVSQLLSVAKLNLNMIEKVPGDILEKIRYSVDLMTQAMNGLRNLSQRLDSDMIRQEGLYMAIEEYISQLRKSIEHEIVFNASGYTAPLPVEKELILFRILQEAINNILKHAEAGLIVIDLSFSSEQLQLQISDDGKGFDLAEISGRQEAGAGIKNMQKRSAMIGGKFSLETGIDQGTRVSINLDILQESQEAGSQEEKETINNVNKL